MRAYYPDLLCLALTATASEETIGNITKSLHMKNPRVIKANPNRANILLQRKQRSGTPGDDGYEDILVPVALQLKKHRERYPLTIIYFSQIRLVIYLDLSVLLCVSVCLCVFCVFECVCVCCVCCVCLCV